MKVVHIGSNTTGGAGLGMAGIHKALLECGVDSRILTMRVNPGEENDPRMMIAEAQPDVSDEAKLLQQMKSKYRGVPMSLPYSSLRLEEHPLVREADVVHLHWVSGMVDIPTFFPAIDKPVVWTVRDENAMMGLYHFARETPVAATPEERALDAKMRALKTEAINKCRDLTYVSLCSAMKERIEASAIGGRETFVIPNRIDTSVFKPGDRRKVREEFGVADGETLILFVAQFLGEKRKGFAELMEALGMLVAKGRAFTVLCVGNGKVQIPTPSGIRLISAGPTANRERMAEFYSAADLFVTPSYSETFGKTTAESIACGTPVVSFPNMGARDIIENGVDGYLSDHFNPVSLSHAIEKALTTKFDRKVMIERIKSRYSQEIIAEKHLALYKHIMGTPAVARRSNAAAVVPHVTLHRNANPRLSIITICYNNAEGLRETLRSTLDAQYSFDDFEQIVVDGGSTDGTAEILSEYAPRLSWYCSEPDNGIYDAMNKGAAHARGEYLLFLNSGDVLLEDMLVEAMRESFNEDLVYADILFLTGSKISKNVAPSMSEITPGWFLFNSLPHQATFIRRALHEKLGGYDATMKISAAPKFIFNALFYHHCSYRKLDCIFSRFDRSGISSQPQMLRAKLQEWMDFLSPYYGKRVAGIAMRWLTVSKALDWDVYTYLRWHPDEFEPLKRHIMDYVVRKQAREKSEKSVVSKCRLSIITVNKNNKTGLEATLQSTLERQNGFADFEQIVVDGGSSDGSLEVINKFKGRLSWYCSEKDSGIYQAMNKGVAHSNGEYLLFLNSGDVLKPNILSSILHERFSEDIVYADMYVTAHGKVTLSHQADVKDLNPGWFLFNTLPHQAAFIRRALHNRLGGYDETMKISAAPKFFFDAVVKYGCSLRKLAKPFSVYDTTGISSQDRWLPEKIKDWEKFWKPYYGERVAAYAKRYMEMLCELPKTKKLAEAESTRALTLERKLQRCEREICALKVSEAYRVGMFVTWPARKAWGGVKCLRENGLRYTAKHFVGKVARLFGSKVTW